MVWEFRRLPVGPGAGVVVLGRPGVLLRVDAVTGRDALQLLSTSGDCVLLRVVALSPNDLRQDSPPGIDEPIAHL